MAQLTPIDLLINTAESASNLKEIRDLQKQIKSEMLKLGEGDEFDRLAKASANLKDRVEEVNERVEQLNPDKFSALGSAARIAGTGIQLATGAMGMFGDASEDTAKQIAKVQQALALAQGLSQIGELEKDFKNLWKTISTNPLGIAVAVVSALVGALAALDAWITRDTENVKALTKAYEQQKKQTELLTIEKQHEIAILEAQGDQEEKVFERKKALMLLQLQEIKQSFDLHAARVKQIEDNDSLYEGYLKMSAAIFERMGLETAAQKSAELAEANKRERQAEDRKAMEEDFQRFKQLENDLAVLQINETKRVSAIDKKAADERVKLEEETARRVAELRSAFHEATTSTQQLEFEKQKKQLDDWLNYNIVTHEQYLKLLDEAWKKFQEKNHQEREKTQQENAAADLEKQRENLDAWIAEVGNASDTQSDLILGDLKKKNQGFDDFMKALGSSQEDFWKYIEETIGERGKGILQGVAGVAGASMKFLDAVTNDTARKQKLRAIASAVIDTLQGVAKAYGAYPPPFNFIAAGLTAAAGAATIVKIKQADPVGGGGGGSIGGGGGAFTAPNIAAINTEPAGTQPTTPINANGDPIPQQQPQQQQPLVAIVSEGQATDAHRRAQTLLQNTIV